MKLLCINANIIKINDIKFTGDGLVEGKTYTTRGKPYLDEDNLDVYYIDGLGGKLKIRFTELLDNDSESIENIERQIKEALAD